MAEIGTLYVTASKHPRGIMLIAEKLRKCRETSEWRKAKAKKELDMAIEDDKEAVELEATLKLLEEDA